MVRFTMSFPCTIRLSLDFLRSRVSISGSLNELEYVDAPKEDTEPTFSAHIKVYDRPNADIDDTQKTLVLLLKFLLVEDLDC